MRPSGDEAEACGGSEKCPPFGQLKLLSAELLILNGHRVRQVRLFGNSGYGVLS
jgi:hypothetical protein